jgi:hypothetical protein
MSVIRDEEQVHDRRYKVANGISLLQYTRCKPPCFNGEIFERVRCCHSPDTPHHETEHGPQGEELCQGMNKPSGELNQGAEEKDCYKQPLASKMIGQCAEKGLKN